MNVTAKVAPAAGDSISGDMPLLRRLAIVLGSCVLLALIVPGDASAGHPHDRTIAALVDPLYRQDLEPMVAVSCAAAGCHGGPRPGVAHPAAAGQSAYALWLERDPHARSWQTICGPESVAMMTRLGILQDSRITDQAGFDNCLACHNTYRSEPAASVTTGASRDSAAVPADRAFIARHTEGVGCAACHGPAQQWINQHFLSQWQPEAATDRGFIANDDLLTRARMCASCHVGDRDRDLNHDIIAAGHPPLRFEMVSHHARLPKHWRERDAADRSVFEAQLWSAGAVASADAWLALQQGRALRTTAVSIWPELAAHDCSSCHQGLRLNSDRDSLSDPDSRGSAKMAHWDLAPLMIWAHADLGSANREEAAMATEFLDRLDGFRRKLEVMPAGVAEEVAIAAAGVRERLPTWALSGLRAGKIDPRSRPIAPTLRPTRLTDLIVRSSAQAEQTKTWEAAAQFYLLLMASQYEWSREVAPEMHSHVRRMRLGLSLPAGLDSPRYSLAAPLGPELTRQAARRLVQQILGTLEVTIDSLPQPVEPLPPPIESRHTPHPWSGSAGPSVLLKDGHHVSVR